MVRDKYLEAKFGRESPGSDRFTPDDKEIHASQISDCQRKRVWKHDKQPEAESSSYKYFELGRVYEVLYGAMLALEHDPSTSHQTISNHPPWDVADQAVRVQQDVEITIEMGNFNIVGEADWVIFEDDLTFEKIILRRNGKREVIDDGKTRPYTGNIKKVVETKTTGNARWVKSHGASEDYYYQVYPYMRAMDAPGEIAYLVRDDLEEMIFPVTLTEEKWMDCELRAATHHANYQKEDTPPTTPLTDSECKFCPFKAECRQEGGSVW